MAAPGPSSAPADQALPAGWAVYYTHEGMPYYYNAATGQSTHQPPASSLSQQGTTSSTAAAATKPKKEKPKSKEPIPGAEGWLKVTTNLGNVFYTHTATKRSEWIVPDEIREAVEAMEAGVAAGTAEAATFPQRGNGSATSVDGKRKREDRTTNSQPHAEGKARESEESGIDAAELLAQPPQDEEPQAKRSRGSDAQDDNGAHGDDDDDDDAEWQQQLAAQMAAEAAAEDQEAEEPSRAVHQPPQAPIPAFSPPPPPPGGYSGPPPGFHSSPQPPPSGPAAQRKSSSTPSQPPVPEVPQLSLEEGRALFMRMLTSLNGTREEVNPMAPWDKELPKFVHRSEYTGLGLLKDRQDAFNDWCRERLRERREAKKLAAANGSASGGIAAQPKEQPSAAASSSLAQDPRQIYETLLRSTVTSTRTRFDDFRRDHKKDRRFYSFGRDDREREKVFKAWLVTLGEEKRAAAQKAEKEFEGLLEEVLGQEEQRSAWAGKDEAELKDKVWRDVKKIGGMEKRGEYEAVGSSSRRADLFAKWAKQPPTAAKPSNGTSQAASESQSQAGPSSSTTPTLTKEQRQAQALAARQAAVQQQSSSLSRQNARALHQAQRQDASLIFSQLLIDLVRDPIATWEDVSRDETITKDSRWSGGGSAELPWGAKREMFEQHREGLIAKKRAQLEGIFERFARGAAEKRRGDDTDDSDDDEDDDRATKKVAASATPRQAPLNVDGSVLLPLIETDDDYERLAMRLFLERALRRSLREEWDRWHRLREEKAKREFFEMLKENSFVDFWGRLRSEAAEKAKLKAAGNDDSEAAARRALDQNAEVGDVDPESDEAQLPDLVDVAANTGVLGEVHAVLRTDARYRIWGHKPELREEWVREYLEGLSGRKRTAWA
ncbi:hypothetical protein BDZ90DRAFT_232159 [Jaminaea rosea]|uniref:WW domain-containing protein n=1 Tax=Jaminaea rosea TaxID=1569628 RepID=A0A316UXB2_9BASI|nr:hypothetical protein BDZ90DRAFT_232159 [Jaminaea rosea]PWN27765.1 hypothetical protein BDZ90DRAFT_232159 [Jaminaea rosea]